MLNFPQLSLIKSLLVYALLALSAISAMLMTPQLYAIKTTPNFEKIIPNAFGEWKQIPDPFLQVGLSTGNNNQINLLYDQVLMRTYANSKGDRVMLALAYAREQKQDVKIHRPEVCYVAQGFQLIKQTPHFINIDTFKPIAAQRLLMKSPNHLEAVSYWIRIGNDYPTSGLAARLKILREGLNGKILDGILVRVSTVLNEDAATTRIYNTQEEFLKELVLNVKVHNPNLLIQ